MADLLLKKNLFQTLSTIETSIHRLSVSNLCRRGNGGQFQWKAHRKLFKHVSTVQTKLRIKNFPSCCILKTFMCLLYILSQPFFYIYFLHSRLCLVCFISIVALALQNENVSKVINNISQVNILNHDIFIHFLVFHYCCRLLCCVESNIIDDGSY